MALNCFKNMRFFVWSISILFFVDIIAGVYFRSALTTIERRFELSTTKIAFLLSSSQIGNLAVLPFVSYYGSRTHRPRFIAIGTTLVAAGFLIASLPQFFGERYEYVDTIKNISDSTKKQVEMCDATTSLSPNTTFCEEIEKDSDNNLYILIVCGLMLSGIGAAPLQPLGMSYIDDFSHPKKSPVYIGIVMTVALIGPAFGFLLGAALLRIWVDVGWTDTSEIKIEPTNPSWVGAWWLGFLLTGVLIAIASIPIFFFPKEMKKEDTKDMPENSSNGHNKDGADDDESDNEKAGMLRALKKLFGNGTYLMILLLWIISGFNIVGVITFFPKYLEVQFGVSASKANMYFGSIAIPCLALGTMLGSYIMKRHNPDRFGMIKMLLGSQIISTTLTIFLLFLGCETIDIAGVTVHYSDGTDPAVLSPISSCNAGCGCTNGTFTPVCGVDGITYLSPCHAGCKEVYSNISGITQNFTDCGCINTHSRNANDISDWAHPEQCIRTKCGHLIVLVLAVKALSSLSGGVGATPSYMFLMRSVGSKDKAFAIGIAYMIARLLAWIPGPIIYGKAIDSTCIYWAASPCGGKGYCRVFNTDSYRTIFFSIVLGTEIGSCCCVFVLYCMTRKIKRSDSGREDYAAEREKKILLTGPNNSIRAAARLASECESASIAEINGNNEELTMKNAFSSTEMLS